MKNRYLTPFLNEFIQEKMVFIGGPRQVGKTTLALRLLGEDANETHPSYLNCDAPNIFRNIKNGILPPNKTIIFDEIHKNKNWKKLIKGLFDTQKSRHQFCVTGSARLDLYQRGGDSLLGRYHSLRLHPFTLGELGKPNSKDVDQLLLLGGFPEPFLKGSERSARLWRRQRLVRIIREDVRDLENIYDIRKLELLAQELPIRVGSPLSINSLREELEIDHKTASRWVQILENMYFCFRISPYGSRKIRAVKKEQKLYLWDWSSIEDEGARFENFVASHLLKYCHFLEDTEGYAMDLRYIRTELGKEIDFVVLKDSKPIFMIECKKSESVPSSTLFWIQEKIKNVPVYQVHHSSKDYLQNGVRVLPFYQLSKELSLV